MNTCSGAGVRTGVRGEGRVQCRRSRADGFGRGGKVRYGLAVAGRVRRWWVGGDGKGIETVRRWW